MIALITSILLAAAACANPSIVSTAVQSMTTDSSGLNHYTVGVTIQNVGTVRQPSDLLQSIVVEQDGERVDVIGLLPLRPRQTQHVVYSFVRSSEAGAGTTHLSFALDFNKTGANVTCHRGAEDSSLDI
ncbi:MAG TPA: hypothetical protein VFO25_12580 [Candidatus Eremiobacteraceae bacterium]|nr:hypothetical protein [Candidatus Eremiobacteraceae bacterium]